MLVVVAVAVAAVVVAVAVVVVVDMSGAAAAAVLFMQFCYQQKCLVPLPHIIVRRYILYGRPTYSWVGAPPTYGWAPHLLMGGRPTYLWAWHDWAKNIVLAQK